MNAVPSEITKLLLAQIAAESYLDGETAAGIPVYKVETALRERLKLGSNNQLSLKPGQSADTPSLTGYTRMTDAQVAQFVERYDVVDHLPNTMTGFSATLLWDRLDNRYVLSFRSTEYPNEDQGGDWGRDGLNGADGEIGNFGFAYAQIADMEAYYRQIVKPLLTDPATGAIRNFAVTGYSLGGHLATVFAEAHQTDPGFLQAYTFNAPGHGAINGDMAALVNQAFQALSAPGVDALLRSGAGGQSIYNADNFYTAANGIRAALQTFAGNPSGVNITAEGSAQNLAGGKITQVFGKADTDDATWVANSGVHSSNTVKLFIEDQPDVQGLGPITVLDGLTGVRSDFGTTHSITLIADTLAVMTLLQKLMPAMTAEAMAAIFSAGSNERGIGILGSNGLAESNSLERVTEALFPIFGIDLAQFLAENGMTTADGRLPRGLAGGGFGNLANRNLFYVALDRVGTAAGTTGNYRIEALIGQSMTDIVAAAGEASAKGIAYRYALKEGNSFAVIRDIALYDAFNTGVHAGELDLYTSATRSGALTEDWIKDRADFLERLGYFNNLNARYDLTRNSENPQTKGDSIATRFDSENIVWDDRVRDVLIRRETETEQTTYRRFGSDTTDVIDGGQNADRLYGGGGTDYVIGQGGADYLEGGAGLDIYEYDSARDGAPDGHDTILDVDGQGMLRYLYRDEQDQVQSTALAGVAIKEPDGKWKTADGRFVLEQTGADLKVSFGAGVDGSVTLKDFDFTKATQGGYLGIRLVEARTAPQTGRDIFGDRVLEEFTGARTQQKTSDGLPLGFTQIGGDFFETPAWGTLPGDWVNAHLAEGSGYTLDRVSNGQSFFVLPASLTFAYNQKDDLNNLVRTTTVDADARDGLFDGAGNDKIVSGGDNDDREPSEPSALIGNGAVDIDGRTNRTRTRCKMRTRRQRATRFKRQTQLTRSDYRETGASVLNISIKTNTYLVFHNDPIPPSATKNGGSKWAW